MIWIRARLGTHGLAFILLTMLFPGRVAFASDEADVRATVKTVFEQLKSRDYNALYEELPSSSRSRLSRERFTNALRRAQDIYVLDRMDVGSVRVANNIAVVDTILYGRVVMPLETEGKIEVQQYLVREDGRWRVATGDRSTIQRFLARNPAFARKFPIRQPRIYIKQNGNWVEFRTPRTVGAAVPGRSYFAVAGHRSVRGAATECRPYSPFAINSASSGRQMTVARRQLTRSNRRVGSGNAEPPAPRVQRRGGNEGYVV